jgi:glycosyltransferase involved in cell wall biosynthesis
MTEQDTAYAVRFSLVDYSSSLLTDQTAIVTCDITNTGTAPWPTEGAHPVRIAYHWLDERGAMLVADGRRAVFTQPVMPCETPRCEIIAEPPPHPGTYTLQIDLVAEQRAWFSELGLPTLDLPVTIRPLEPRGLRVCILNTNCLPNDAVGNCVIEQLKYFEAQGHSVCVLTEFADDRLPLEVRRAVFTASFDEIRDGLSVAERSWRARQFYSADLYIFHYSVYYPLIESIRFVQSGTILFDYHGLTPPHLWGDASGLAVLVRGQEKAALAQLADYAIVHSHYMAEELQQHSGLSRERIRVIPYAVAVEQFRPQPRDPELAARYGLQGQRVLLYIGRMAGNKRIDDLVRMLAGVRRSVAETKLLLVGDDTHPAYRPIVARAKEIAAELGCADRVIFTGAVDHAELGRYYNLCDVYVTSSLHEGFCIPVIEAMACGRPVVATNVTALPETVGDAGMLFPAEDTETMAAQVVRILESYDC